MPNHPIFLAGCVVCGKWPYEVHHIKTRGSGGGDEHWNLMPLCSDHHTQNGYGKSWHAGRFAFIHAYPAVQKYLRDKGWKFEIQVSGAGQISGQLWRD